MRKSRLEFSLIVCTLGRSIEIEELFESLENQKFKDFEVILIDQNEKNLLEDIVAKSQMKIKIKHIKSKEKGLSKARNRGIKVASGNYIAFPDDDCQYNSDTLLKIFNMFQNTNYDFITCNTKEKDSNNALVSLPNTKKIMQHNFYKIYGVSFTLFFNKKVISKVGEFDETLGVGSGTIFGAGEETDYLIRVVKNNYNGLYIPNIYVYHPAKELIYNQATFKRALMYGGGMGRVVKKHFNFLRTSRAIIAPLIKSILSISNINKAKFYFINFIGTLRGYYKS
ncbi:glycosyl transferase family 2 [Lysinibacillus sp. B2A1]|nr:glycosyl transferase family 2 [Lysinibacillus sp. B2A1]